MSPASCIWTRRALNVIHRPDTANFRFRATWLPYKTRSSSRGQSTNDSSPLGNNTRRPWDVTLFLVLPDSCFATISRLWSCKVPVALTSFPILKLVHSLRQLLLNANFSKAFIVPCWKTIVGAGALDRDGAAHNARIKSLHPWRRLLQTLRLSSGARDESGSGTLWSIA